MSREIIEERLVFQEMPPASLIKTYLLLLKCRKASFNFVASHVPFSL